MKKRPRSGEDGTLDAYLREISRFPSLTLEEERDLAGRIRHHRDEQAFRRLVEAHLRFVVGFAGQYRGLGVLLLDLIDEGNLGLIEAARRYDPERDGQFITYAVWWIRQSILHTLAEQGRAFAAPAELPLAGQQAVQRARGRRALVDAALWDEMAEVFDDEPATPRTLGSRNTRRGGREAALVEDDGEDRWGAMGDAAIDDGQVREVVAAAVREALHHLAPREREIVRLRFGLDAAPLTVDEVSDRLAVPKERVRQIESRAAVKLRRSHKARELQSTLN